MTEQTELPSRAAIIQRLTKEIAQLRQEVAASLDPNSNEAQDAAQALDQAETIIGPIDGQLNEAIYQVARVRTMLTQRRLLRQGSRQWGGLILAYALLWLLLLGAGFWYRGQLSAAIGETSQAVDLVRRVWLAALAGGLGGVLGIFFELAGQLFKKEFDRQFIMAYALKPVMGFFLGAVTYFIIQAGFLVIELSLDGFVDDPAAYLAGLVNTLNVVIALLVGFRQRWALEWIDKIIRRFSPATNSEELGRSE
jgi:hypothetical protein